MLVNLRNTSAILVDLPPADVEWVAPSELQVGTVNLRIPRSSPAFSPVYIAEQGGSYVEIVTGRRGIWRGIADLPAIDQTGATLPCRSLDGLFAARTVGANREFRACTAGTIIRAAFIGAMAGLGVMALSLGATLEAPPIIGDYQFSDQYLSQVISDMTTATGQEYEIDTAGRFHWRCRVGRMRSEVLLTDDTGRFSLSPYATLDNQAREVIERESAGQEFTAFANEITPYWPRQEVRSI